VADLDSPQPLAIGRDFKLDAAPGLRQFEHLNFDPDLVPFVLRHHLSFRRTA
jgi:hypothetical protein